MDGIRNTIYLTLLTLLTLSAFTIWSHLVKSLDTCYIKLVTV